MLCKLVSAKDVQRRLAVTAFWTSVLHFQACGVDDESELDLRAPGSTMQGAYGVSDVHTFSAGEVARFGQDIAFDGDTFVLNVVPYGWFQTAAEASLTRRLLVLQRDGEVWPDFGDFVYFIDLALPAWSSVASSMEIQGDTLLYGSRPLPPPYDSAGRVIVLSRNGGVFSETGEIADPHPSSLTCFGEAIALDGDRLAISAAPCDVDTATTTGSVFIYQRADNQWSLLWEIQPPTDAVASTFGTYVAMDGHLLAVLADGNTANPQLFVYRLGASKAMLHAIVPIDKPGGYPTYLAVDDPRILVGVWNHCEKGAALITVDDDGYTTADVSLPSTAIPAPPEDCDDFASCTSNCRAGGVVAFHQGLMVSELLRSAPLRHALIFHALIDGVPSYVGQWEMPYYSTYVSHMRSAGGSLAYGRHYEYSTAHILDFSDAGVGFGATASPCSSDEDCALGFCRDQVCCDSHCGGNDSSDCLACSVSSGSPSEGVCSSLDGYPCDGTADSCHFNACVNGVCDALPIDCEDGDPCTENDCSLVFDCQSFAVVDGSPCADACTPDGTCQLGYCVGTSASCDDGNPCTMDRCANASCSHNQLDDDTPCAGGACFDGACIPSTQPTDAGASLDAGAAPTDAGPVAPPSCTCDASSSPEAPSVFGLGFIVCGGLARRRLARRRDARGCDHAAAVT